VREGCVEYTALPDKIIKLEAGGIIWIPPNVPFKARAITSNPWLCAIRFDLQTPASQPSASYPPPSWWAASFDLNEWLYAFLNLERINLAAKKDPSGHLKEAASSGLHVLFGILYESINHLAGSENYNPGVLRVRRHLDNHPEQPLDTQYLANLAQLNPDYLNRLFKVQVGTTIKNYHSESRMRYARAMLSEGFVNVSELSTLLGYSEPAAFSRAFKVSQGCNPSDIFKHFSAGLNVNHDL
jgi:AraC-like DNA-binding protein